ncbi:Dipeptidyl aminopeptidase/acylaminoacyl peptidase [Methanophagales archaeon]|nr:Dipeptidyl aminopeptidase/acylaminoacyl peptidase [Methanophagales archaeon]
MSKKVPFVDWTPAITPEEVFSDIIGLNEIQVVVQRTYWLEMRPVERGRCVVMQRDEDGVVRDITPQGFNVRTRVHEYGGGAYTVYKDAIYFVNFDDQRIYYQSKDNAEAVPLTPITNEDGSLGKYAALSASPDGTKLLFVYEKEYRNKENANLLAVLDLAAKGISKPQIIAKGSDFYADPIFSPTGKEVAWLQWDHPDMPWDSTELMMGSFEDNTLHNVKKVADGGSICFPRFDRAGKLYYAMDKVVDAESDSANWWNLYCFTDAVEQITAEQAEFGEPHWVFGQSNYDFLPDNRIIAKMVKDGADCMVVIDPEQKSLSVVETGLSCYSNIRTDAQGRVFFIGASAKKSPAIICLDIDSKTDKILKSSSSIAMKSADISLPKIISYPTKDGEHAHGFLYMPRNSRYTAPEDDKPPLLVMAHGGPTSSARAVFSAIIQFWTSAGFAVIDVNYRGSTGYGRRYRDKLLSQWGVIDAEDVADAVRYLIKAEKVDGAKVAVRGGSAGGYMVQRVMTQYPDFFAAGASYYGIGNLITLVEETHKFESRYIDNLIGVKLPAGEKEYRERSPINHLDRLKAPMIIFQGTADKIVTPECSRELARNLEERGIRYEYVEYEGESHGFRIRKNNVDSLSREFAFYRVVFSS